MKIFKSVIVPSRRCGKQARDTRYAGCSGKMTAHSLYRNVKPSEPYSGRQKERERREERKRRQQKKNTRCPTHAVRQPCLTTHAVRLRLRLQRGSGGRRALSLRRRVVCGTQSGSVAARGWIAATFVRLKMTREIRTVFAHCKKVSRYAAGLFRDVRPAVNALAGVRRARAAG